jgi:hypothetical protein
MKEQNFLELDETENRKEFLHLLFRLEEEVDIEEEKEEGEKEEEERRRRRIKEDTQCKYNITLGRVYVTTFAAEKR